MNYRKLTMLLSLFLIFSMVGSSSALASQKGADMPIAYAGDPIQLGGLFPLTGTLAGGGVERDAAARMAVSEINKDTTLLANNELKISIYDTATDPATGVQVAGQAISDGAIGLIGAASSGVSAAIASGPALTSKVPQISYSSTSPDLSNKETYPYFLRVVPPDSVQGVAVANVVKDFGWKSVSTLATSDDYGLGGIGVFETTAKDLGITIATSQRFAPGATDVKTQLQQIADSGSKIIVINCIVGDAQTVFSQAADLGLTAANGYVWVGTDGPTQAAVFEGSSTIKANMQGMIGTAPNRGTGDLYNSFLDLWENCNGADNNTYAGCGDRTPNTYATFAYDAVYAFARAIDQMIKDGADYTNGDLLLAQLYKSDFVGVTGHVAFNADGDRLGVYDLLNLQGDAFKTVGSYDSANGVKVTGTIYWDGTANTVVPADAPSESSSKPSPAFGLFLAFAAIAVIPAIRKYKHKL